MPLAFTPGVGSMRQPHRSDLLFPIPVTIAGVGALIVIAAAIIVYVQVRSASDQYAWATQGRLCSTADRTPSYIDRSTMIEFSFEDTKFAYVQGDADCTTTEKGRLLRDQDVTVCFFQHPEFIIARTGRAPVSYSVPVGGAVVSVDGDAMRCILKSPIVYAHPARHIPS